MRPKEATVAVTYRCNARCQMCNIWKSSPSDELDPRNYLKLPSSLRTINITGGEPFLRKDLVEVVRNIHTAAPFSRIVFSTNGLLTETILSSISQIRTFHQRIGVGVSIDGPEEIHDSLRGVKGIFKRAVATIEGLKKEGIGDLRIGMTLMKENAEFASEVYGLSRNLGVEFSTTFAHNSEIYFQKTDNVPPEMTGIAAKSLKSVRSSQLRSSSVKDWLRAYHIQGIMDSDLRKEFVSKCEAGSKFVFISPSGEVFPCLVMNMSLGNLKDVKAWDELASPDLELKMREAVKGCKEDCWMVCNTRTLILSHPVRAGVWVARNKVNAHLHGE